MSTTLEALNPEVTSEIRDLLDSNHPNAAEQRLLDYVVAENRPDRRGRLERKTTQPIERRMRNALLVLMTLPVLVALYFIISLLTRNR